MNKLLYLILLLLTISSYAETLHSEKSLYRNISVEQIGQKRCMIFGRRSKNPYYQSCINLDNKDKLVFSYTKLVLAGLSLLPEPKSILIVGLGGGTLPMSLERLYPDSKIDTLEIDPAVLRVAKQWFSYKETNKQRTYLVDGRVYGKRQIRNKQKYDLIILDAFNGDYIPEHLMTMEFLNEMKQLLQSDGLLVANTFSNNNLYDHESATYHKVFGSFHFIHSQKSGNRIIYARKDNNQPIVSNHISISKMKTEVVRDLIRIGVNFKDFKERLTNVPDWKQDARILSDQYSPANLLNQ